MPRLKLSAVVPCYNEREGMQELHRRVSRVCQACVGDSYELVLVNDGSKDATWQIMRELSLSDKHVVAINLSRNYGHQLALSSLCQFDRPDHNHLCYVAGGAWACEAQHGGTNNQAENNSPHTHGHLLFV